VHDPRLSRLLDAVLAVAGDLDLETVLARVVEAGCALVDARYGALGVIGRDKQLDAFVHQGIDAPTAERIGSLPAGRGILGLLIDEPTPLRLDDLSAHPASYGFPDNHPPMHAFLGAPIVAGEKVFGNLYLTEKIGGGTFTAEDEELVVGLAAVAGAAIDNARLYDDLRHREAWRDAVLEVTTSVLAGDSTAAVRDRVTELAAHLGQARGACLIEPYGDEGMWVLSSVGDGPPPGFLAGRDRAYERVLAEGGIEAVEDDPVLGGRGLWIALRDRDTTVAAIGLVRDEPFDDRDEQLLFSFASQASLSLAHERAQADLHRLSLIEDRERIGRDLHDTVIQRLFATGLSLQAAVRRADGRPDVAEKLNRAVDDIDETVREIRSTIFALQSTPEDERGLRHDLLEIVDELTPLLPRTPRVRFDGALDALVPVRIAEEVIPVVREALTNVARHAAASDVELELSVDLTELRVRVADDGRGLPAQINAGFGIANLRRRAQALAGEASIGPRSDGTGTVVEWVVPLH
jgi:two-component system, NarL family, sensor histidine kinase DevS